MTTPEANSDILLCTLNAKYIHSSFGLRCLMANLGPLRRRARLLEFTIHESPERIVAKIGESKCRIVGFGVYIWNTRQTLAAVRLLKHLHPEIRVILGGPEVSHETELQEICGIADHVIRGEADVLFRQVCERLLSESVERPPRIIDGPLPDLQSLELPYSLYADEDIRHRVIYVEASRGCAFKCEYCLSSLDTKVRSFELERFLQAMDSLIARGARQFKFVDRTFNLSLRSSTRILEFFLERISLGLFLHFEMVPDRLPLELRDLIRRFPPGSLQLEVGIQTWNAEVSTLVSRKQDFEKIESNLRFLRDETGTHIHADLIAGLPGESWDSFAAGFDRLAALGPQEIQLGILKRLRGTPIIRHDAEWRMIYSSEPPYEVQETRLLSQDQLTELRRIAKTWDLIANRGYFQKTRALFTGPSLFAEFHSLSRRLWSRFGRLHGIDLFDLAEGVFHYLSEDRALDARQVAYSLLEDLQAPQLRPVPAFLKPFHFEARPEPRRRAQHTPKRQSRFQE